MKIKFTPKFTQRLEEVAQYVYQKTQSKQTTTIYIKNLKKHIVVYLTDFPKLGRPAEEFGKDIRKLVHQKYSILYRIESNYILIITIYRENLP